MSLDDGQQFTIVNVAKTVVRHILGKNIGLGQ